MTEQQDLNTPFIAVIGLVSSILVFAIIVLLVVVFRHVESQQEYIKSISRSDPVLASRMAHQEAELASYGWVDQQKGIVQIPIGRAMRLVVEDLSRDDRSEPIAPKPKTSEKNGA